MQRDAMMVETATLWMINAMASEHVRMDQMKMESNAVSGLGIIP